MATTLHGVAGLDVGEGSTGDGEGGGDSKGGDDASFDGKDGGDQGDEKGANIFFFTLFCPCPFLCSVFAELSAPSLKGRWNFIWLGD